MGRELSNTNNEVDEFLDPYVRGKKLFMQRPTKVEIEYF